MPRPFLIAFVGRSGSTAMKFDLDQHPGIEMRAEAMGGARLPPWPGPRDLNDANRLDWLEHHWRERGVAAGFKLQFDRAAPQFDDPPWLASAVRRRGAVIFRLVRRDRVRHAVSVLRAEALREIGGAGAIQAGSAEAQHEFRQGPVTIDPAAFEWVLHALTLNTADRDAFLAGFDAVEEIAYEDYLADRLSVLNAMAAAVDVEPFDAPPPQVLLKVSPDDLRRAVANYDEIAAVARQQGLPI